MRTVNKAVLTACILTAAFAATASRAEVTQMVTAPTVISPDGMAVPPTPAAVTTILPGASTGGESLDKSVSAMDDKAIDSGHNALHRLNSGSDQLSFEDLNSARQTVARIDAMIEVEKHLGELQKLRNERNNGGSSSSASLANVIPASALSPPPKMMVTTPIVTSPSPSTVVSTGWLHDEVTRITGSDGKYTAVLKLSDGTTRHVKTGDEIPHGKVSWISSSAVGIEEGGKTRTLHVKNVEMVYSTVR